MELSFSPAASRQILKTTDSETEEAARTKHLAEEKQRGSPWRVKTFGYNKSRKIASTSKHANKRV